jgi:hypothetical protein
MKEIKDIVCYSDNRSDSTIVQVEGTYCKHGAGYVSEGDEGVQEYQGPKVAGPWAFFYPLASVLTDNYPGKEADLQRKRDNTIVVSGGELVRIDGHVYKISLNRQGSQAWIDLEPVKKGAPKCPRG